MIQDCLQEPLESVIIAIQIFLKIMLQNIVIAMSFLYNKGKQTWQTVNATVHDHSRPQYCLKVYMPQICACQLKSVSSISRHAGSTACEALSTVSNLLNYCL